MRAVTVAEVEQIVAGLKKTTSKDSHPMLLKPPGGSGSGGGWGTGGFGGFGSGEFGTAGFAGNGGSWEYYDSLNPLLGNEQLTKLASDSGLLAQINENHITIMASAGSSQTNDGSWYESDTNTDHIVVNSDDPNYAVDAYEQIAHENGHALSPEAEPIACDYPSASSYGQAADTYEGYAQENALHYAKTLNDLHLSGVPTAYAPGTISSAEEEQNIYDTDTANGASSATIASAIGPIIGAQLLGDHKTTEQEHYEGYWNTECSK